MSQTQILTPCYVCRRFRRSQPAVCEWNGYFLCYDCFERGFWLPFRMEPAWMRSVRSNGSLRHRKMHRSQADDVPPSWDNVVRAYEDG